MTRHHQRGKLLPRERIELLLDPDSPFLELSPVAAYGTDFPVGASVVTGIGVVEGVECLVVANDPTVRGGAVNPWSLAKTRRAGEIALANRLPMVNLVESAGADLPTQAEIFIPGGRVFRDLTRLSAAKIPTVSVVFGNATAGGAYVPGMSDYTIMIRERSQVYLAGPPLVKMATGEVTDDESLGGAAMHATTSGLADFLASDERDGIRLARQCVRRLNWRKQGPPPRNPVPQPPKYDPEELLGIASADLKVPFDPREVLARVLDGSEFDEFKPALRHRAGHRLGRAARVPGRRAGQRPGRAVQRGGAEGGPVHPARQRRRHPAGLPAEHHRLHGRHRVRAARHHQARRPDDQRGVELDRAAPDGQPGRLVRRRQLRHVRPGVRAAVPVHLAERQVGGDGPGAAGRGAVDRGPAGRRRPGPRLRRGLRRRDADDGRAADRVPVRARSSSPAGSTTTG